MNDPLASNPVAGQLLVSSGPLVLREFTQTNGVYLQLNNLYFGESQNLENIDAFEATRVQGIQVWPGNQIKISSQHFELKQVSNASYSVCIYGQNGVAMQCVAGKYDGQDTYSAVFLVDSRFHPGMYRVEGTVYGALPNGTFIIFEEKRMIVRSFPLVPVIILVLLILVVVGVVVKRQNLERSMRRIRRKRRVRRVTTVRGPSYSRRSRRVRKRT